MQFKRPLSLAFIVVFVAWLPWFMAAYVSWPAGSAFETQPGDSDAVSQGAAEIRKLKENIRDRLQVEHYFGTGVGTDDNGRHREGSAVQWFETPCPTSNVTADPGSGVSAYGTNDQGRLCKDTATGEEKVWNGSSYETLTTASAGDGSHFFNLLSGLQFKKAGSDAMDIHSHHGRHGITGSNGAWVVGADFVPFTITDIVETNTVKAACNAGLNNTVLASQAFGNAGNACMSITRDTTGRGSHTTRGILLAHMGVGSSAACIGVMNTFLDNMSTPLAPVNIQSKFTAANQSNTIDTFYYVTALSTGAHEFAMHADDAADDGCVMIEGSLMWIDLGIE
jgi:hypothetical protein